MNFADNFVMTGNGRALPLESVPSVSFPNFRKSLIEAVNSGGRLSALPVWKPDESDNLRIIAVISFPSEALIGIMQSKMPECWPSITLDCPAAHMFEREIAEQWGIRPEGHPWLKPVRFEQPRITSNKTSVNRSEVEMKFYSFTGGESHEVAVGPVHAGVIEPGHFRFICHGETVYHLEISLGYQHRGIEQSLCQGPSKRSRHYVETLAGDSSVGHALAYSHNIEALSGIQVPARGKTIRAIAAELERIANHTGDLGAMAGDVGFLPTMNYCGRIRGDVLNMTAVLCGNRFGRGLVCPSGVEYDADPSIAEDLLNRLKEVETDLTGAVTLMFDTPSVLARFESTGKLTAETAKRIGLVGVPARACGLDMDIRAEFPYGLYRMVQLPLNTWPGGDCFSRALVRWMEVQSSIEFIRMNILELPQGSVKNEASELKPGKIAVSLIEGWRGEVCHVAATDSESRFAFYKVVDPSFHNWFGLALALRGQQISDFPLCNKSFNLSYCGHDL